MPIIDRDIVAKILRDFHNRDIVFLLGTRQVGKTTISRLLAKGSGYPAENILFIDFEDKRYREMFNNAGLKTLKQIVQLEGINSDREALLIFDEVQLLDDPANLLKLMHDHFERIKIVATGSSSLDIRQKFSDSLAGRKKVYVIEPLSFDEFLHFRGEYPLLRFRETFRQEPDKDGLRNITASLAKDFMAYFEEYLLYGAYPEIALIKDKRGKVEKLDSIATSYIQKDIRDIARIENIEGYNKLLKYLAVNACAEINLSNTANAIGLSRPTIGKYLTLLEQTFIIKRLLPFYRNRSKEITKMNKVYYKDTGIRNLQIKNFNELSVRTDAGELFETYVFNVLDNSRDILTNLYFYRTQLQTEIDFIRESEGELSLIEVKSGDFRKIPKPLVEFEKKYGDSLKLRERLVINRSYLDFSSKMKFLPVWLL